MEKHSKKILAMPVYSIQEGQNMGLVKNIIIDAKEKKVVALLLEKRRMGKEERLIPFINIKSIGDSAIIIDRAINAERKNNLPPLTRYLRNPIHIIGSKVFTTNGNTLGRVEEYLFDDKTGKITALEISGGLDNLFKGHISLEGQYIITIAPSTIMVDEEVINYLEYPEINPRQAMGKAVGTAVNNAREKAGSVITGTIKASKKISRSLQKKEDSINCKKTTAAAEKVSETVSTKETPLKSETPSVDK
ncbi:MAG: PRC-barrel domain-containing protein [Bacillota bacterium]|jgi:uncharacterized protein YrrD